jgi:chromosome segregation ATPase
MFSSKREKSGAELLPSSGEALAERVDMLASTVSSTAAALARTDGEIAGLRRELGSGLARIEELVAEMRSRARTSDVRELEKKVGALAFEQGRTSDTKRLDDVSSKLAVLAERVDTLGATVAATAAGAVGREGEVAALRRMLDEGSRPAAPDDELVRRVEDVVAASASASLRLESHGDEIGALGDRIESLEARLSGLAEKIEAAERDRVALAASIADAAAARWRELERMLVELAGRLDASDERAAAISTELSRATSLWPAALRALEGRVDELAGGPAPGGGDRPRPAADAHVLGALQALEQQLARVDAAAREERELLLDRLDRLAGRLEQPEPAHREAEVVPFRVDA